MYVCVQHWYKLNDKKGSSEANFLLASLIIINRYDGMKMCALEVENKLISAWKMHILVYFLWNKNYGKKEERLLLKCQLMQSHTVDEIFSIQCDVEKCSYNRKISISRCEQF